MNFPIKLLTLILTANILLGCFIGPQHSVPEMSLPSKYSNVTDANNTNPDPTLTEQANLKEWWKNLNDPILDGLIDEAIKSNLDLKLALSRIKESRSLLYLTIGEFLPSISGEASYERSKDSAEAKNKGDNNTSNSNSSPENLYKAGFDASWEFNIFNLGRSVEAAEASLEAQEEETRNVLITLLAEIAQNYVTLRGLQQQLLIAQNNSKTQNEAYEVQQLKLKAGSANELSVAQAEAQLLATQSTVPTIETSIKQAIYRLSVLLAKNPSDLENVLTNFSALPHGAAFIPPGLPSELLRRRPDIRQAERELAAATAEVGVAIGDLFPSFSITGTFGAESMSRHTLSKHANQFWSGGIALLLPVFDSERYSRIAIQDAQMEQAVIKYKQTVLNSLEEVENALVAYEKEQLRRSLLEKSVAASQRSVNSATELNNAGITDFLNVLTAQQSLFQAQDQLAQSDRLVTLRLVTLYKVLGGGWETLVLEKNQN